MPRNLDARYAALAAKAVDGMITQPELDEAQSMVDDVANNAGLVRSKHATGAPAFTVFSRDAIPDRDPDTNIRGFHFSNEADECSSYQYQNSKCNRVMNVFIDLRRTISRREAQKMVRSGDEIDGFPKGYDTVIFREPAGSPTPEQQSAFDRGEAVQLPNGYFVIKGEDEGADLFHRSDPHAMITGYCGLNEAFSQHNEFHIVVRDPSQIKSADPFTFDDDDNLIPLSERFRADSPDIRHNPPGGLWGDWWIDDSGFATFADGDIGITHNPEYFDKGAAGIGSMRDAKTPRRIAMILLKQYMENTLDDGAVDELHNNPHLSFEEFFTHQLAGARDSSETYLASSRDRQKQKRNDLFGEAGRLLRDARKEMMATGKNKLTPIGNWQGSRQRFLESKERWAKEHGIPMAPHITHNPRLSREKAYDLMVSELGCGPFDGGCLVYAKALQKVYSNATLVTMIRADRSAREGQAEHYGIHTQKGEYIDADGTYPSAEAWIEAFSTSENIMFPMEVVNYFVPGEAVDDSQVVDMLAKILNQEPNPPQRKVFQVKTSNLFMRTEHAIEAFDDIMAGRVSRSTGAPASVSKLDRRSAWFLMDGYHRVLEQVLDGAKEVQVQVNADVPNIEHTGGAYDFMIDDIINVDEFAHEVIQ